MHKMVHCTTIETQYNATQKGQRVRNIFFCFPDTCK